MKDKNIIIGAAFLTATSAIGPGFLTQTATFTEQLGASFAFIVALSIIMNVGVQFNIWRVITISKLKAQDIANKVLPGLGYFLSFLVVLGGLAFNIGNVAGAGLGLNSIFGIDAVLGAMISALIAVFIFMNKNAGSAMDNFAKLLGIGLLLIIIYIVFNTNPPLASVGAELFTPSKFDAISLVTLVGGTVGGYISFSGAHRLLDAKISDQSSVTKSAVTSIVIAGGIRVLLFLAVLGTISHGVKLDAQNPALTPFTHALSNFGAIAFGAVIWAASITSVVGCAYTSVSFITSFSARLKANENKIIIFFIVFSTLVFATIGKPAKVLVLVGTLNGLILPIALLVMLIAAYRKDIIGSYRHSKALAALGYLIVLAMGYFSIQTIINYLG